LINQAADGNRLSLPHGTKERINEKGIIDENPNPSQKKSYKCQRVDESSTPVSDITLLDIGHGKHSPVVSRDSVLATLHNVKKEGR